MFHYWSFWPHASGKQAHRMNLSPLDWHGGQKYTSVRNCSVAVTLHAPYPAAEQPLSLAKHTWDFPSLAHTSFSTKNVTLNALFFTYSQMLLEDFLHFLTWRVCFCKVLRTYVSLVYLITELITQDCDYCLHFSLVGKAAFPEDLLTLTHPQQPADVPVCTYVCVCVYMHVCVYVYAHTHVYMYTHIHSWIVGLGLGEEP